MMTSTRQRPSLPELQSLIASFRKELHSEGFYFSEIGKKVRRGTLNEVSGLPGSGKTELLLRFLNENQNTRVAWIEERFTLYPCAFPQKGVALNRILFVEAGQEVLWTASQILRSQLFDVVVVSASHLGAQKQNSSSLNRGVMELRRLQLETEKAHACLFKLSSEPTQGVTWPFQMQVHVNSFQEGKFDFDIIREKGGQENAQASGARGLSLL